MNLGEFYTRVSTAIKRGSSLDDIIPLWAAQACELQEQNYTFSWMRRSTTETLLAGSVTPNKLVMPARIKEFDWIKPVIQEEGGYEFYGDDLIGVDERQVLSISYGLPSGYWLDGLDYICFDAFPGIDQKFKLKYAQYSEWPSDESQTPKLLERGFTTLLTQTLLLYALEYRDERMIQTYSSALSTANEVLLKSEEALKMSFQNDLRMAPMGLNSQ